MPRHPCIKPRMTARLQVHTTLLTRCQQHFAVRKGGVGEKGRLPLLLLPLSGGAGGGGTKCCSPSRRDCHASSLIYSKEIIACCSDPARRRGQAVGKGCGWHEAPPAAWHLTGEQSIERLE